MGEAVFIITILSLAGLFLLIGVVAIIHDCNSGGKPQLLIGTSNGSAGIDVDGSHSAIVLSNTQSSFSNDTYTVILISNAQLAALGLTNKQVQFNIHKYLDSDNSCAAMQFGYLGTTPEAQP
jgi:hypothetical protein